MKFCFFSWLELIVFLNTLVPVLLVSFPALEVFSYSVKTEFFYKQNRIFYPKLVS